VVQPREFLGASRTDVAVISPDESFAPVAKMHSPAVMSARVAVDILVIVVVVVYVTVTSPLAPVRMSVLPLICTNWPEAPPRGARAMPGLGDAVFPALAELPQAARTKLAPMHRMMLNRLMDPPWSSYWARSASMGASRAALSAG